jgi:hypothetical protein
LIVVSAIKRNLCAFARDVFSQRRKGKMEKVEHEILFRFLHMLAEGSLSMTRVSVLKATNGVIKAGLFSLKPTGAQT